MLEINEYHGEVISETVKGDEDIQGKLYYEVIIRNNNHSEEKKFRLYNPVENSYKNKTVFVQYHIKKTEHVDTIHNTEYAVLSKASRYYNNISNIIIDEKVEMGIIFLPIINRELMTSLGYFFIENYTLEGPNKAKIEKKKIIHSDNINNHINYSKDVLYIYDDYYNMICDKYFMEFLTFHEKPKCSGFEMKYPSFILNDGKIYLGKTLWDKVGKITDFSQPLTQQHLIYILKDVKEYKPKKIDYFLETLKKYGIDIFKKEKRKMTNLIKPVNENVFSSDSDKNNVKQTPFISDISSFIAHDVNIIATESIDNSEKVYFSHLHSDLILSFIIDSHDVSNHLKLSHPDNRMLLVYNFYDKIKNPLKAPPLYTINKMGFSYCHPKGIFKKLNKYMEIGRIKKLTSSYIKHLDNEKSSGYFTKKIIIDSLNADKKVSKRNKKNKMKSIEDFFG